MTGRKCGEYFFDPFLFAWIARGQIFFTPFALFTIVAMEGSEGK